MIDIGLACIIGAPQTNITLIIADQMEETNLWTSLAPEWNNFTDDVTVATTAEPPDLSAFYLGQNICLYAAIFIIPLGIVGNILAIAVLLRGKLDSTRLYLIHLACADLLCILVGHLGRVFPLALTGYDVAAYHPGICQTWLYLNGAISTAAAWTIVAVTIERVMVVYVPLKAKAICTTKRAIFTIVAIDIVFASYFVHYYWSYGPLFHRAEDGTQTMIATCTITKNNAALTWFMNHIRPYLDLLIRSAGPFFCLLISNCLIVGKILLEVARRRWMSHQGAAQSQSGRVRSMTVMLLMVSFVYLLCVTPLQIMIIIDKSDPFGKKIEHTWQAESALRWACALAFYYVNNAVNFLLYCVSGAKFRAALRAMFKELGCCCCGGRGGDGGKGIDIASNSNSSSSKGSEKRLMPTAQSPLTV